MNDETKPQGDAPEGATKTDENTADSAAETKVDKKAAKKAEKAAAKAAKATSRPSVSARLLRALVLLLIGAGGALWLAPQAAPYVPAPVAELLAPPAAVTQADLRALRSELRGLDGGAAPAAGLDDAALQDAMAPLRAALEDLQADGGAEALASNLTEMQAGLGDLATRLEALEESEATLSSSALVVKLEAIVSVIEELGQEMTALSTRVDAAETSYAEAAEAAEAEAAAARRSAALDSGFSGLGAAMATGRPFEAALTRLAEMGAPPPAALAEAARQGLPSQAELTEGLAEASRLGMEAWEEATAPGMFGWAASMFAGEEEAAEGEGPDVALQRAAGRMAAGDPAGALAAVRDLPEVVAEALAGWADGAGRAAAAQAAADDWREALEAEAG